MRRYKLIVFDLDDTLFDYAQTERFAVTEACASLGIQCDNIYAMYRMANDAAKRRFGDLTPQNIQAFRIARADAFLAATDTRSVSASDFVEEYLNNSTVGVLIEGVLDTLARLHGVSKVVATNGSEYPRRNKLEGSGIAKYVDGFFSSESLGVAKPNPEFFARIFRHCSVQKQEALVVGDSYRLDIEAAAELGVDCCWFDHRRTYRGSPLPQEVSVITRFDELVSVIAGRAS